MKVTRVVDPLVILFTLVVYLQLLTQMPQGDGNDWAHHIDTNTLYINQNYILLVPSLMAVHRLLAGVGLEVSAFDLMQVANALAATVIVAVLAVVLRQLQVSAGRRVVLLLLAGFSYNILLLATCDHVKLLAGPFLAFSAVSLMRYGAQPRFKHVLWAGFWIGVASTFLVSSILCAALIPFAILWGPRGKTWVNLRDASAFGVMAGFVPFVVLFSFYLYVAPASGFLSWVASYGKSGSATTVDAGFQAVTAMSVLRAGFAYVNNFVDSSTLGPYLKSLVFKQVKATPLSGEELSKIAASLVLAASAAALFVQVWLKYPALKGDRFFVRAMALMSLAFVLFAIAWNSSEEEYWYQVTLPTLAVAAVVTPAVKSARFYSLTVACLLAMIVSNVFGYAVPRKLYPFDKALAKARTTFAPNSLVITDGMGPTVLAVSMARDLVQPPYKTIDALSLVQEVGWSRRKLEASIEERVRRAIDAGGCIYTIGIFDAIPSHHPWTILNERVGLTPAALTDPLKAAGRNYVVKEFFDAKVSILFDGSADAERRCVRPFSPG